MRCALPFIIGLGFIAAGHAAAVLLNLPYDNANPVCWLGVALAFSYSIRKGAK